MSPPGTCFLSIAHCPRYPHVTSQLSSIIKHDLINTSQAGYSSLIPLIVSRSRTMSCQFRPLLSRPTTQAQPFPPTRNPSITPVLQQSTKKSRNRHLPRDWEDQKVLFIELYCTQGKSLGEATKVIEERCGFKARLVQAPSLHNVLPSRLVSNIC